MIAISYIYIANYDVQCYGLTYPLNPPFKLQNTRPYNAILSVLGDAYIVWCLVSVAAAPEATQHND